MASVSSLCFSVVQISSDPAVCVSRGFTNEEELFLIPEVPSIFPFLLKEKLVEGGADFKVGYMYLKNVVHDENLITGQNPWSTWRLAETMIAAMGYNPKKRIITPEENSIEILGIFQKHGYEAAKMRITEMAADETEINRVLLAMHSIVAAMQWDLAKSYSLMGLLKHSKDIIEDVELLQSNNPLTLEPFDPLAY